MRTTTEQHEPTASRIRRATVGLALAAAERHARAALGSKERHLGPDHPELAVTLTTLGTIRRRRGDRREAARLHRRALGVLRPSVVPGHPVLHTIEHNLATATRT